MNTLTLRRVPPNLLVGQGATEFAADMGMPILPHDALISPAAKERWIRWRADLKSAERKAKKAGHHPSCWKLGNDIAPEDELAQQRMREQHTQDLLRGYPSHFQSPSPVPSDEQLYYPTGATSNTPSDPSLPLSEQSSDSWFSDDRMATPDTSNQSSVPHKDVRPHTVAESSRNALINSTQKVPTLSQYRDHKALRDVNSDRIMEDTQMEDAYCSPVHSASLRKSWGDGSGEESASTSSGDTLKAGSIDTMPAAALHIPLPKAPIQEVAESPLPRVTAPLDHVRERAPLLPRPAGPPPLQTEDQDYITDTVGAIAVDSRGNIACGASSGGIGMKYRGRVGPAALVGVGAAVIPIDPDDPEQTCVATVTSGTGEHMATTMAATVCAERLYQSMKKSRTGEYVEVTEDEALRSMIETEFMGK